jgi:hypothetical protein
MATKKKTLESDKKASVSIEGSAELGSSQSSSAPKAKKEPTLTGKVKGRLGSVIRCSVTWRQEPRSFPLDWFTDDERKRLREDPLLEITEDV